MKNLAFATVLFFNSFALACPAPISYLKEGDKAACNGYLLSPEKEKELRTLNERYKIMTEINTQQKLLIANLSENVLVTTQISKNLEKKVALIEEKSRLEQIVYFALGALAGFGLAKIVGP